LGGRASPFCRRQWQFWEAGKASSLRSQVSSLKSQSAFGARSPSATLAP